MGCSGSSQQDPAPAMPAASGTADAAPQKAEPSSAVPDPNGGAGDDDVAEAPPKLSAEQLFRVQELFKAWDIDTIGKLPLAQFQGASLTMGPHETGILKKLVEMDFDSDGFVTQQEWEQYFAASASLSAEEFDLIINSMQEAADMVVTIIRATRIAAEYAPAPPTDEMDTPTPLSAGRVAAIEALFAAWDVDNSGSIDRRKLTGSSSVQVGPQQFQIFSQLEQMDTDGDNLVTKTEMLAFFQAASNLTDDEFELLRAPMHEVASDEATIKMLTKMATDTPATGPPAEDLEAAAPLSEARLAALKNLWDLFPTNGQTAVKLEDMKKAEQGSKIGPHSVSVLKELYAMDTNSDGMLDWKELLAYFTATGALLSDDEYDLVVGDMTDRIQMQLLAESLGM